VASNEGPRAHLRTRERVWGIGGRVERSPTGEREGRIWSCRVAGVGCGALADALNAHRLESVKGGWGVAGTGVALAGGGRWGWGVAGVR
jgi:hypothetical protein